MGNIREQMFVDSLHLAMIIVVVTTLVVILSLSLSLSVFGYFFPLKHSSGRFEVWGCKNFKLLLTQQISISRHDSLS